MEENVINKIGLMGYFKFCVIIFHGQIEEKYKNNILAMLHYCHRKVIILKDPETDSLSDDCSFENLQSDSKTKILGRKV